MAIKFKGGGREASLNGQAICEEFAAFLFAIGYPVKFFILYNLVVTVVKIVSSYWISDRSMNL